MQGSIKAVIFDMDGVLIESEHLWRRAMIEGFKEYDLVLSENDCRQTMGLRIGEVVDLWLTRFKRADISSKQLEHRIVELLLILIDQSGAFIQGIPALIAFCREKKLKLGLATSSSVTLMNAVLKKFNLENEFHSALSAEYMAYGKPHPQVFLACAEKLETLPQQCLVIEDSLNGVIAAKAAQMKVIAVPDEEHSNVKGFAIADYKLNTMHEVLTLLKASL